MLTKKLAGSLLGLLLLSGCAHQEAQNTEATGQASEQSAAGTSQQTAPMDFNTAKSMAGRGDIQAQVTLGNFYFMGKPTKDLKQAEYWWKLAADRGHPEAAVNLAFLYSGQADPALANEADMLKYLNQSAAGGNAMAQHMLGNFYMEGLHGLPKDAFQAKQLYKSACDKKFESSCQRLSALP
jgi:TPR repeat protein